MKWGKIRLWEAVGEIGVMASICCVCPQWLLRRCSKLISPLLHPSTRWRFCCLLFWGEFTLTVSAYLNESSICLCLINNNWHMIHSHQSQWKDKLLCFPSILIKSYQSFPGLLLLLITSPIMISDTLCLSENKLLVSYCGLSRLSIM